MRDLIYGYEIKNGLLRIKKSEAKYIRYIFQEYLAGRSLYNISAFLNENTVPVHKKAGRWTHSMIGHILNNLRYSGDMGYPNIVTKTCQQNAIQLYNSKTLSVARKIAAERNKASPFYGVIHCGCCGSKTRLYEHEGIFFRKCPSDNDKNCVLESDLQIMALDIINAFIENNELINQIESIVPNLLEITKIENQLNCLLKTQNSNFDEINKLLIDKYQGFYKQYADNHMADSMRLKERLSLMKKQNQLSHSLVKQIMNKIILDENDKVVFILVNNQRIDKPITYKERRVLCQEQQEQ